MNKKRHFSTRGILNTAAGFEKFTLKRFEPGQSLQPFVEHYWMVRYNLEGSPYKQTVLSFPNVHLAFEQDFEDTRAQLYGVPKRTFVRELKGSGQVLGVKFRAGGFYPFYKQHVALLTGSVIPATHLFGDKVELYLKAILNADHDAKMASLAEQFLLEHIPERDMESEFAASIVQFVMDEIAINKVEQLSVRTGLSVRKLQRLFQKYVGVSPKWVIKRFRLQEAAERLAKDESLQWAELALQLGYFDQAHFIKDFKSIIGESPAVYKKIIMDEGAAQ